MSFILNDSIILNLVLEFAFLPDLASTTIIFILSGTLKGLALLVFAILLINSLKTGIAVFDPVSLFPNDLGSSKPTLVDGAVYNIKFNGRAEDLYISETQIMQKNGIEEQKILDLYSTALNEYPNSDNLLYNRGLFYADLRKFEKMEIDLQKLISRNQNHAQALNALGYTLADLGIRLDEALAYIMRAYKLKPDNPAILDSMGWAYYKRGDFSAALQYLRKAFSVSKDDEISAHLGEVLWMSGEREEAKSIWRSSLKKKPESVHIKAVMQRFLIDE